MNSLVQIICITGGIGTGKSTVSNIFSEMGYTVLDTDSIAKNLLNNNELIKSQIIDEFGPDSYNAGTLNNKYLSNIVFSNPSKLAGINKIVHPAVIKYMNDFAGNNIFKDSLLFVESAIVFEAKLEEHFDIVIAVTSELEVRLQRLESRDKDKFSSVQQRIGNQMPAEEVNAKADYLISNNFGIDSLKEQCLSFIKFITEKNNNSGKIIL